MQRDFPLTLLPKWKIGVLFLVLFSVFFTIGYFVSKAIYQQGIKDGITAYHAQCLVGGFLIDDKGQAVMCAPLSKTPPEEKQTYKDKVLAPSLFN